jgi:hypothetical protein
MTGLDENIATVYCGWTSRDVALNDRKACAPSATRPRRSTLEPGIRRSSSAALRHGLGVGVAVSYCGRSVGR